MFSCKNIARKRKAFDENEILNFLQT